MDERMYLYKVSATFECGLKEHNGEADFYIDDKTEGEVQQELERISREGVWTYNLEGDYGTFIPGHRIYYMTTEAIHEDR